MHYALLDTVCALIIWFSNRLVLIILWEIQVLLLTWLQSDGRHMFLMYQNLCDPTVSSERVQQVCPTTCNTQCSCNSPTSPRNPTMNTRWKSLFKQRKDFSQTGSEQVKTFLSSAKTLFCYSWTHKSQRCYFSCVYAYTNIIVKFEIFDLYHCFVRPIQM